MIYLLLAWSVFGCLYVLRRVVDENFEPDNISESEAFEFLFIGGPVVWFIAIMESFRRLLK